MKSNKNTNSHMNKIKHMFLFAAENGNEKISGDFSTTHRHYLSFRLDPLATWQNHQFIYTQIYDLSFKYIIVAG